MPKYRVSGKNGAAGVISEKPFKVLQANPPLAKLIAKLKKNGMTLMMPVGPVDAPGTVKLTEETGGFLLYYLERHLDFTVTEQ